MDFPLLEVCDDELGEVWAEKHFHHGRLRCPGCGVEKRNAGIEGYTKRSHVVQYRCRKCRRVYTVYYGTVFAHKQIRPAQAVLLLRGICKGEATASLARELGVKYDTVLALRRAIHRNAQTLQSTKPLPDDVTETDEMFQNAGEKRQKTWGSCRSPARSGQQATRARHL
jgi:transposase-like protein